MSSWGPPPARLVLLSDLPTCLPGQKVRFLGCVDEYVVQTATLRLKHNYPISSPPQVACVNIKVILESTKHKHIDVGTWINVFGYVERTKEKERSVYVQAVTIADAVDVDLVEYQTAVEALKETA